VCRRCTSEFLTPGTPWSCPDLWPRAARHLVADQLPGAAWSSTPVRAASRSPGFGGVVRRAAIAGSFKERADRSVSAAGEGRPERAGPVGSSHPHGSSSRVTWAVEPTDGTTWHLAHSWHEKRSAPALPGLTCTNAGGRYWDRTSDLFGVKANRKRADHAHVMTVGSAASVDVRRGHSASSLIVTQFVTHRSTGDRAQLGKLRPAPRQASSGADSAHPRACGWPAWIVQHAGRVLITRLHAG
jgi:hypothetical protein